MSPKYCQGLPRGAQELKHLSANAGDTGSIPGGGSETHSSIFARKIPWTEEPSRLQGKESDTIKHARMHKVPSRLPEHQLQDPGCYESGIHSHAQRVSFS